MCETNRPFQSGGGGGKSSLSVGFALERVWKNLCGKEWRGRKSPSAVLLLLIDPSLEKESRKQRPYWLCLEKGGISQRAEEEPAAASGFGLVFSYVFFLAHQLIYGLFAKSFNTKHRHRHTHWLLQCAAQHNIVSFHAPLHPSIHPSTHLSANTARQRVWTPCQTPEKWAMPTANC